MSTTLTVGATTVTLHDDLQWTDEFEWQPVEQAVQRSLTGALLIDVRAKTLGRPITLAGADLKAAWMPRATIAQLYAWASVPDQAMTLSLRGVSYTVKWRHEQPPALTAVPVIDYADVDSADWYRATLKLMVTA